MMYLNDLVSSLQYNTNHGTTTVLFCKGSDPNFMTLLWLATLYGILVSVQISVLE